MKQLNYKTQSALNRTSLIKLLSLLKKKALLRNKTVRSQPTHKIYVFFAFIILFVSSSYGQGQPNRVFTYYPNKIYSVSTGLGIASQIIIDPSEKVKDFGTGFSAGWDVVRRDNVFYLKPKDPDAETNMYIRTDKRSYLFDLKIVTKDWKRIDEAKLAGVSYVVSFIYLDNRDEQAELANSLAKIKPPAQTEPVLPVQLPHISYHMDYDYAAEEAAKWLVPVRVYDDGEFTYIQMSPSKQSPTIFARDSDRGEEFLVNKTIKKNTYIVHGIYPFLVLRHGNTAVGIRRR